MSLQQRLVTLAAVKFMKARLDEVEEAEKAAVKREVGGRLSAAAAILPDDTEGATVSISKPRNVAAKAGGVPYVSNPALFTEWVEKVDPSAIVKSVRTTDVPRLLAKALDAIEQDGELPPGVELSEAEPARQEGGGTVSVRQSETQAANVLRNLMAGAVPLPSLAPQIEEAPSE